ISHAMLKIYYTDSEVANAGLNETDLAIWWYNETLETWQILNENTMDWVYGTDVNMGEDYVWANVSHFSDYTIGAGTQSQEIKVVTGWNLISLPLVFL
ncbi:MAG: hypothetical protein ABH851_00205, partial [Methanobacteriota archaeon]